VVLVEDHVEEGLVGDHAEEDLVVVRAEEDLLHFDVVEVEEEAAVWLTALLKPMVAAVAAVIVVAGGE
jgi:hypothetical protein